jgi:tetratricopeptide (TPR) repeat protein
MIGWLWVAALLFQADRAAVERWRDALELDLPTEVLAEAPARVTGEGDLARDGEAIGLLARAWSAAGQDERAEALLSAAAPTEATRGFVETARARLALDRDDLAEVLRILAPEAGATDLVRFPEVPEAFLFAGRARARRGEPAQAARYYEAFLARAPLDVEAPSAWHGLVQAALATGDEARAAQRRAQAAQSAQWQAYYRTRRLQARAQPGEPLPRLGIAELFLAAGEPARAEAVAAGLVLRFPDFCRGFEALGRAQRGLGRLAEARGTLERGLACDPAGARTILELARTLRALGAGDDAAVRYARYVELGGTEPLEGR